MLIDPSANIRGLKYEIYFLGYCHYKFAPHFNNIKMGIAANMTATHQQGKTKRNKAPSLFMQNYISFIKNSTECGVNSIIKDSCFNNLVTHYRVIDNYMSEKSLVEYLYIAFCYFQCLNSMLMVFLFYCV